MALKKMAIKSPLRAWSLRSRLVLGVVLLTAAGYIGAGVAAQNALQSYLLDQVDIELVNIATETLPRIAQSGIEPGEYIAQPGRGGGRREHEEEEALGPLRRIPTTASVTLFSADGTLLGEVGGDFNTTLLSNVLEDFDLNKAIEVGSEPFTATEDGESYRAIAVVLPDQSGVVVAGKSLGELNKTIAKLDIFFLFIGLALLILIALAARTMIKIGMRPLEDVEKTAEQIASGDLSARMPEANPHTEVGRLVTSLNSMLARIETSFAARTESENRLRRFVADASHELRTPITAIRGFSELHRQGAVAEGDATKELIGRIEDESKRMGSLVEDLLLLARLDQAREMESKPVNLSEVVESAVISARAAGPNHSVAFDAPNEEVFALGDEARIHQVVANLLANARAHTPAGTKITVSLSRETDGVRIAVADNGPGLSEEDQKRIFERFYRADPSRVRVDGEGSGLGLSIVDAVMGAHGGTVTVQSELGKGATFTLFFPLDK